MPRLAPPLESDDPKTSALRAVVAFSCFLESQLAAAKVSASGTTPAADAERPHRIGRVVPVSYPAVPACGGHNAGHH